VNNMGYEALPHNLLESIDNRYKVGDSFRLIHEYTNEGNPCSLDKDPCLVVTRYKDCWKWYCHRCYEHGIVFDNDMSPTEVSKRLSKSVTEVKHSTIVKKMALPMPCYPMWEKHAEIPYEAYHWIWSIDLDYEDCEKHMIVWSPSYQRVIIPIHENDNLVGWVGREVYCKDKEERKVKRIAKYITQKQKGQSRLFFRAKGKLPGTVIVEDILSAIKVNKLTDLSVISLLNTAIDDTLISELRDQKIVYVWLDGDMHTKIVRYTKRFNELGLKAKSVRTSKDPKEYSYMDMKTFLAGYTGLTKEK
jgi:hypothetical protein